MLSEYFEKAKSEVSNSLTKRMADLPIFKIGILNKRKKEAAKKLTEIGAAKKVLETVKQEAIRRLNTVAADHLSTAMIRSEKKDHAKRKMETKNNLTNIAELVGYQFNTITAEAVREIKLPMRGEKKDG